MNVQQLLDVLEENACILRRTQINLEKCPKQRLTKGYIEGRMKCIHEYWQSFKAIHQDLIKCTTKENRMEMPYFEREEFYIIEDLYVCLFGDLQDMLYSIQTLDTSSGTNCSQAQITLPIIQLPTFTGIYEEWPAFHDLFTSLIDKNVVLSDLQKLHYLKASLSGEAEDLLKHINVTEINYEPAWKLLKHRYGNKRIMINSILKRLFSQQKMKTPTANNIKKLLDITSECLDNLKNLQVGIDKWDLLIVYFVIQRLDIDTHKSWEEHCYNHDSNVLPTWEDLKHFLEFKFRTLEMIMPTATPTTVIGTVQERTYNVRCTSPPVKCCILCKEKHRLCHCEKFKKMIIGQKEDFVRNNALCLNCLNPGHTCFKCRVRVTCRLCNQHHHTLLHKQRNMKETDNAQLHFNKVKDVQNEKDGTVITLSGLKSQR